MLPRYNSSKLGAMTVALDRRKLGTMLTGLPQYTVEFVSSVGDLCPWAVPSPGACSIMGTITLWYPARAVDRHQRKEIKLHIMCAREGVEEARAQSCRSPTLECGPTSQKTHLSLLQLVPSNCICINTGLSLTWPSPLIIATVWLCKLPSLA